MVNMWFLFAWLASTGFGLVLSEPRLNDKIGSVSAIKAEIKITQAENTLSANEALVLETQYHATVLTPSTNRGGTITFKLPGGVGSKQGVLFSGWTRPQVGQTLWVYFEPLSTNPSEVRLIQVLDEKKRNFSRNRTDGSNGEGVGNFLYWKQSYFPIPYAIVLGPMWGRADFVRAIDQSFQTWQNVTQTGVSFRAMGCSLSATTVNDGKNNTIFIDKNWPLDNTVVAVTRNFYITDGFPEAGQILDSDILVNGQDFEFTTTGEAGKYDLQSIITHEVGHLLSLGHEVGIPNNVASMYAVASPGETHKRTLSANDKQGLISAYPEIGQKQNAPLTSRCLVPKLGVAASSCAGISSTAEPRDNLFIVALITLALSFFVLRVLPKTNSR